MVMNRTRGRAGRPRSHFILPSATLSQWRNWRSLRVGQRPRDDVMSGRYRILTIFAVIASDACGHGRRSFEFRSSSCCSCCRAASKFVVCEDHKLSSNINFDVNGFTSIAPNPQTTLRLRGGGVFEDRDKSGNEEDEYQAAARYILLLPRALTGLTSY